MDLASTFDAYYKPLYRYLVRLCGDVELAADAAQEAFLRLAERPPTNYQNVKAWLYTVGGNYIRDALKVARRRIEILKESPERTPLADQPLAPDTYAEQAERRAQLHRAMESLNLRERTVLLMRAEGFSYRDVAEAVEVSSNSVGVIAARALRKLSTFLQEPETAGLVV